MSSAREAIQRDIPSRSLNGLTVLVADRKEIYRLGLVQGLTQAGATVVAQTGDGIEAGRLVRESKADLMVLDARLPSLNGLEIVGRIVAGGHTVRAILLIDAGDESAMHRALSSGVLGIAPRTVPLNELVEGLRTVLRSEIWLAPSLGMTLDAEYLQGIRQRQSRSAPWQIERLTPRQREILQLIAEGKDARHIAERLSLSIKTVETHRAQLMERLGLFDVALLTRFAIRHGLVAD